MERKLPEWMLKRSSSSKPGNENQHPNGQVHVQRPLLTFEGNVRYLNTVGACGFVCEAILKKLESLEELVIGFDLEWPVQRYQKGQGRTALIQLCPSTKVCYLFHVWRWSKLPQVFVDLIRHPKVRLTGINIRGDVWKLGRDFDISVSDIVEKNTIELRRLANEVFLSKSIRSLEKIVLYVLKKRLDKSLDVRTSNWAQETLSQAQLDYAATDAYASLLVYQRLKELEEEINLNYAATSECMESRLDELFRSSESSESIS